MFKILVEDDDILPLSLSLSLERTRKMTGAPSRSSRGSTSTINTVNTRKHRNCELLKQTYEIRSECAICEHETRARTIRYEVDYGYCSSLRYIRISKNHPSRLTFNVFTRQKGVTEKLSRKKRERRKEGRRRGRERGRGEGGRKPICYYKDGTFSLRTSTINK